MKKIIIAFFLFGINTFYGYADNEHFAYISKVKDATCGCNGEISVNYVGCSGLEADYMILVDGHNVDHGVITSGDFTRGINNLCPGTYHVQACWSFQRTTEGDPVFQVLSDQNITINDIPFNVSLNSYGPRKPDCDGTGWVDFTVSGRSSYSEYTWTKDGQAFTPSGSGDGRFDNIPDGSYTITVFEPPNCSQTISFSFVACDNFTTTTTFKNLGMICGSKIYPPAKLTLDRINGDLGTKGTDYNIYYYRDNPLNTYDLFTNKEEIVITEPGSWYIRIEWCNGCWRDIGPFIVYPLTFTPLTVTSTKYNAGCDGNNSSGSIQLDVSGGATPYQYNWDYDPNNTTGNANNLSSGNYGVTVTDANGCYQTLNFEIETVPKLDFTLNARDIRDISGNCWYSLCTIENLEGTPPFTITWDNGEPSTGSQNKIYSWAANHHVRVTDANGCVKEASISNPGCSLSEWANVTVNPNPATYTVFINMSLLNPSIINIKLYDGSFTNVLYNSDEGFHTPGNYIFQLDMSSYMSGPYYIVASYNGIPDTQILLIKQ